MPIPLDPNNEERPDRRQITGVFFSVVLDTSETPAQIPTLTASVTFTDLWRSPNGDPRGYQVPGQVVLTHAELMAIPGAPQTLGAVQALAYQKAAVELQ